MPAVQTTDPPSAPVATSGGARSRRAAGVEYGLILLALACVEFQAVSLPVRDVPLGIDWQRYLGNALAIAQGDWAAYQTWRGPLHPFLCLFLTPVAGRLLEASQLVSMLAVAGMLLCTAALGRRLAGPWAGAGAAWLLAVWPDLALQARMSTPYPLLAALVVAGLYALNQGIAGDVGVRWPWAVAAGVGFGLAGATDARGLVFGASALVGTMLAFPVDRRRLAAALAFGGLALITRAVIIGRLPVQLLSLPEQIALQRDLHAREAGVAMCVDKRAAAVVVADLWSACGRETAWRNLVRMVPMAPWPWGLVAVLAAAGVRRRTLPLLALILTLLPAAFVVGVEHRYLLPLAGPVAILLVGGLFRTLAVLPGLARSDSGRFVAASVLALVFAIGWRTYAHTLMDRATGRSNEPPSHAQAVRIDALPPIAVAREALRRAIDSAPTGVAVHVVDCAGLSLDSRLYPTPVEEASFNGHSSSRCRKLLAEPSSYYTFILARSPADPSWIVLDDAGADLRVYVGR